jgi:CRP/FNR family transcriptional regulator, cyclic AMP receptor protein
MRRPSRHLFIDYVLARIGRYQEGIMDQLLNSSEKRLARVLLVLANLGNGGKPEAVFPKIDQEELAEMVGTTRSRIGVFYESLPKTGLRCLQGRGSITIRTAELSRFVMA